MRHIFVSFLAFVVLFTTSAQPAFAQAPQTWAGECVQEHQDRDGNTYQVATIQGLQCLLGNVLTVFITIMGLAAFVMFLYGSFRYLLSGGNSKATENARSTITFAVIGIVVALASYIILQLLTQFTGIELRNFIIPSSTTGL